MSQRTLAGIIAVPLLLVLWVLAVLLPVPFVAYQPGLTVNVLADVDGKPVVQVSGHPAYHDDDGQLRLTTALVTRPDTRVSVFEAMAAWFDSDDAVLPEEAVYPEDESREEAEQEGQAQMAGSQETAVAAAMKELGYDVRLTVQVAEVTSGGPAAGKIRTGDEVVAVAGEPVASSADVARRIQAVPEGRSVEVTVERSGEDQDVRLTPEESDGKQRIGIATRETGYTFPFDVSVTPPSGIGGPSAGMMFSLGVVDTLTKGSLTGGGVVAGTGTIDADGNVGAIGAIQQKIAGSRRDGAELFLVPADNCAEALGGHPGDMRLARVATLEDALAVLKAWSADHDADLPSCEDAR